jgi:ketosteroid isomerase-like protein
MIKTLLLVILLPIVAASVANSATPIAPSNTVFSLDEAAIRAARKEYNAALVFRDPAVIAKYWLQDAQSVWANGELTVGRDNIIRRYAKTFHDGEFVSGIRTPQRIDVATGGRADAAELGTWEWRMRFSGKVLTWKGRYLAMWHKVDDQWRIRSDLYVVTACTGGSACK